MTNEELILLHGPLTNEYRRAHLSDHWDDEVSGLAKCFAHYEATVRAQEAEIEHLNLVIDSKSESKAAYREEMMKLAREVDRLNKQNETMRAALVVVRDYSCRCGIMGSCGCGEVMIRDADDVLDELAEEGGDDGG